MRARPTVSQPAVVLLGLLAFALAGCGPLAPYQAAVTPPTGLLATNIHAPLILPRDGVSVSEIQDHADASTVYVYIPPLVDLAWGDASLQAALERDRLREVDYADYNYTNFLFLFRMMRVRYYGSH